MVSVKIKLVSIKMKIGQYKNENWSVKTEVGKNFIYTLLKNI